MGSKPKTHKKQHFLAWQKLLAEFVAGSSKNWTIGNFAPWWPPILDILNLNKKQKSYASLKLENAKFKKTRRRYCKNKQKYVFRIECFACVKVVLLRRSKNSIFKHAIPLTSCVHCLLNLQYLLYKCGRLIRAGVESGLSRYEPEPQKPTTYQRISGYLDIIFIILNVSTPRVGGLLMCSTK